MNYNRFALTISHNSTLETVKQQILDQIRRIVVNISLTPEDKGMLFTPENLQTILDLDVTQLYLETLENNDYFSLMQQQSLHLLSQAEKLKKLLVNYYITNLTSEFSEFLSLIQNNAMMLECLVLSTDNAKIANQIVLLKQLQGQLSIACFYLEDNVLCMDKLCYEIVPMIKQLLKEFS